MMLKILNKIRDDFNTFFSYKASSSKEYGDVIGVIRNGMVSIIPILLIGAFALCLQFFPVKVYQTFAQTWADGLINQIFGYISSATFGFMSCFMTLSISYCYLQKFSDNKTNIIIGMITSLSCFGLMIGVFNKDFNRSLLGAQGVTSAIFSSIVVGYFYQKISSNKSFFVSLFSDGSDNYFNVALSSTIPATIVIASFAIINYAITKFFNINCIHEIFLRCSVWLFVGMGRTFLSGIAFLFLSTLLWFIGIHGNNVFEKVTSELFQSGIAVNIAALNAGNEPTEIVTKSFLDCFVLLGGCGSTLCLLIALLFFSKRKNVRNLAKIATFPILFNINEIMVFGLPIIFNRFFLIPFLLTPLVMFTTAYLATMLGLVPIICNPDVFWTTPVFFSGYLATGSIAGVILQLINIIIGVFIYLPFIKKYDKAKNDESKSYLSVLLSKLVESQETKTPIVLTELNGSEGIVAKSLINDLVSSVSNKSFDMYFQPQFDNNNRLVGAESLLRWNHPVYGMIYPPLVVKLAEEASIKFEMEKMIFDDVASKISEIKRLLGKDLHISVNVTVKTLTDSRFEIFLAELVKKYELQPGDLYIEITEETNFSLDDTSKKLIERIHNLGYCFALDDFSMGHTSLQYLQTNQFDEVKLDGSIIKGIETNENLKDIVASIIYLSKSMKFSVVAEFVESEEQKNVLEKMGCYKYQGFYYSEAIGLEDFLNKYCRK